MLTAEWDEYENGYVVVPDADEMERFNMQPERIMSDRSNIQGFIGYVFENMDTEIRSYLMETYLDIKIEIKEEDTVRVVMSPNSPNEKINNDENAKIEEDFTSLDDVFSEMGVHDGEPDCDGNCAECEYTAFHNVPQKSELVKKPLTDDFIVASTLDEIIAACACLPDGKESSVWKYDSVYYLYIKGCETRELAYAGEMVHTVYAKKYGLPFMQEHGKAIVRECAVEALKMLA